MKSHIRAILFLMFLTLLGSCEGSMGCSGCGGCGLEPIPGDFPLDKRVENAAQVHVTSHAIDFLENNYDPIISSFFPDGLFFEIPESTSDLAGIGTVDICPGGGCSVNLQILNVSVTPMPPSSLRAVIQVRVAIYDLPVRINQGILCLCWDDCDCIVDFNTADSGRPYNSFETNFVFEIDTTTGYTKLRMYDSQIADDIENSDLSITNGNLCGIAICNLANLDFIKGIIVDQLTSSLTDSLEGPLNESMCRRCEGGCPDGTTCDGSNPDDFCVFPDGTCAPIVLGLMGRMDAGGLLSAFSPGTVAWVDLLAAAGGYARTSATPEAIDLGIFGGAEGAPVSECVRKAPVPCESDTDCTAGFTCRELATPPLWLLPCRRCGSGCPSGSTPRDGDPCQPDPEDPRADYDPSQPCMNDDGSCVPILYCQDGGGALQTFEFPGAVVVPEAPTLQTDQFTHCVFCESDTDCTAPYTCDMYSVCTMEGDPTSCQTATESIMLVAGVSETFLKRALLGIASSGALCLDIPPGTIPQLNSEIIVTALPPLGNLVWETAPVALVLRPTVGHFVAQRPELDAMNSPDIEVGDKPLLNVILRDVTIDFYVWLEDTYSRFLTATFDLSLGVDLLVRGGTLTPILRSPEVNDVRAYNNDLLQMDNEALRNTIAGLIELAMGFVPALDPIEIPEIEMFEISLPDGAVTHVQDMGEDFMVLYANLAVPTTESAPLPFPAEVETSVRIVETYNPKVDVELGTGAMYAQCDGRPYFVVEMSGLSPSITDRPLEYRTRLNGGPWSQWSKNQTARIEARQFIFQGRHTLEVQARALGMDETADSSPASIELLVDGVPPRLEAEIASHELLEVTVKDMVSPADMIGLQVRYLYVDGTVTGWQDADPAEGIAIHMPKLAAVEIAAMDEAGNRTTEIFEIRGRLPPADSSGDCMECAAVGSKRDGGDLPGAVLLLLALLGLVVLRKKAVRPSFRALKEGVKRALRAALPLAILAAALTLDACSCDSKDGDGPCAGNQGPDCCLNNEDCGENVFCCPVNNVCMPPPSPLTSPPAPDLVEGLYNEECDPGFFCTDLPSFTVGETAEAGCWFDWSCCTEREALPEGRLGTHLGMDVADGADPVVWVSGYSPGASDSMRYGDLVAGRWDSSAGEVGWEILDGLPTSGFVTNSTSGWRGGIAEAGDDVGMYTSLALDTGGNPMISYYDRTNGALKFIQHDGSAWSAPSVVDSGDSGWAGLYGDMVRLPSGEPAVLYRAVTWTAMAHPGAVDYQVVHLASHVKSAVRSGASWDVQTVTTLEETPCWGGGCPEGYVCRAEDLLCWPPADEDAHEGCAACSGTQSCLSALDGTGAATGVFECQDILTITDVPEGIGLWIATDLSPAGELEAVYYDRTGGDLVWIGQTGGLWQAPIILDGNEDDPDPAVHGDRGWYPSLDVDGAGARHIVYVDGIAESFLYMQVDAAGAITLREVVDDGLDALNGEKDLVGDNGSVRVDPGGRVRALYQNSSDGILMMALRDTAGTWSIQQVTSADAGFMGYYAIQRMVTDRSFVAHFYLNFESPPTGTGVSVVICTVDGSGILSCI